MKTATALIAATALFLGLQSNTADANATAALAAAAPQALGATTQSADAKIVLVGRRGGGFRKGGGFRRGGFQRGRNFRGGRGFKRRIGTFKRLGKGPRGCKAIWCKPGRKWKFKKHFRYHGPTVVHHGGCSFFKKKWHRTGALIWKKRYHICRGWY